MKIIEISVPNYMWPMGRYTGVTLYPLIFYKRSQINNVTLRRHEWVHIEQIRKMGVLTFYSNYITQWFTRGYHNITFEIEAYNKQFDGQKPWENDKC